MTLKTLAPVRGRIELRAITADVTLVAEDTGITFMLDAVGEDIIIPAAALGNRGVWYRFVTIADTITTPWTITSAGTNDIHCQMSSGAGDDVDVISAGTGKDKLSIVHSVSLEGDQIDIFCTGTWWLAVGHCQTVESVTMA